MAGAFDLERADRLDAIEEVAIDAEFAVGPGVAEIDAVLADPIVGLAPKGKAAGVANIADDAGLAAQRRRRIKAYLIRIGEEKRLWVVK